MDSPKEHVIEEKSAFHCPGDRLCDRDESITAGKLMGCIRDAVDWMCCEVWLPLGARYDKMRYNFAM